MRLKGCFVAFRNAISGVTRLASARWRGPLGVALVAAAVVVPSVLIGAITGSFGIPHDDDWSFLRSTLWLHHTGELRLVGWAQMTVVGLFWLGQPVLVLDDTVTALQGLTVVLTIVLLVACSVLGARLRSWRAGAVAACLVGGIPLISPLTVTYMTDIPALALMMAALAVGLTGTGAQRRLRWRYVVVGLVVAFAAVTIRESAAPSAVGLCAALAWQATVRRSRRALVAAVGAGVVFGCVALAFWVWRHHLPGDISYGRSGSTPVLLIGRDAVLLGLLTLPVCIAPVHVRAGSRARRIGAVIGAIIVVVVVAASGLGRALPGNYLKDIPVGPRLRGDHAQFLPIAMWRALAVLGLIGCVALGIRLVDLTVHTRKVLRTRDAGVASVTLVALGATVASATVLVVGAAVTAGKSYDRYLLPVTVLLLLMLLTNTCSWQAAPRRTHVVQALGATVLAALAVFGYLLALTIDSYAGARWRAGETAVALGAPPNGLDAGPEWVGFHQSGRTHPISPDPRATEPSWDRRARIHPCWYISLGPDPAADAHQVRRIVWYDGGGRQRVFVIYHVTTSICRARSPGATSLKEGGISNGAGRR